MNTFRVARLRRRPGLLSLAAVIVALLYGVSAASAHASVNAPPDVAVDTANTDNTVYYVDWTAANPGLGTASGVINLPNGSHVGVDFKAVFSNGAAGSFLGAQLGCGTNYWNPTAPYISAAVPNAPPNCEILQLTGGQNQIYKVTLSEPIRDPIMAIVSLGSGGTPTTYDFDSPFTIVSQGAGFFGGSATALTQLPGNVLRGAEGHGTIRFLGTFSTFSWTVPTPEYWHGFTFAIRTTDALAETVAVNEGQTAAITGTYSDADGNPVTLSASLGTITQTGTSSGTWSWSYPTTDGPGDSQAVTVTADDGQGGTSTTSFNLDVKNVAPSATLGNSGPVSAGSPATVQFAGQSDPSGADTAAGFHYAFSCGNGDLSGATYAGSGASSSATCTYAGEGDHTVKGRIIDKDGGYSEYTTQVTVKDVTPPVTTASAPSGWVNTDALVTLSATDDSSGVAATHYAVDGGSVQTGTSFTITSDGVHSVSYWSVDNAGNIEVPHSLTVSIDRTPPSISASATTAPNANGWYAGDVTVHFTCADSGSGIPAGACPADQILSGEGAAVSSTAETVADAAGNTSAASNVVTVAIDRTKPTVSFSPDGGVYDVDQTVAIACTASDDLSGVASTTCSDLGTPAWSAGVGSHPLSATATDKAGNVGHGSGSYSVVATAGGVCNLVERWVSKAGIANSLCVKLQAAAASRARGQDAAAGNQLAAFRNELAAQSEKSISAAHADELALLSRSL